MGAGARVGNGGGMGCLHMADGSTSGCFCAQYEFWEERESLRNLIVYHMWRCIDTFQTI